MRKEILLGLMIVLLAGSGAAQPIENPVSPDSPFYFIDRFSESVELAVASAPVIGSDSLEAKVRANHASERLEEARKMAEKNRTERARELVNQYERQLNISRQRARGQNNVEKRLANFSRSSVETLEEVRQRAPKQARKGIDRAIQNSIDAPRREELPDPGTENRPDKKPETDIPEPPFERNQGKRNQSNSPRPETEPDRQQRPPEQQEDINRPETGENLQPEENGSEENPELESPTEGQDVYP